MSLCKAKVTYHLFNVFLQKLCFVTQMFEFSRLAHVIPVR